MPEALHKKVADQIISYIIEKKIPRGEHIVETRLARHFRISRTPIRTALSSLEEQGIVTKDPNRGFFLKAAPETLHIDSEEDQFQEERLQLRVIEDRLSGLLPNRFFDRTLIKNYDLTRSELTRLLHLLLREGWINESPGHGWEFLPVPPASEFFEQAYQCRINLEPASLLQKSFFLSTERIASLRISHEAILSKPIARSGYQEIVKTAFSFHESIIQGSGNPFFIDAIKGMKRLFIFHRKLQANNRPPSLGLIKEHLELLDLIEEKQFEKASLFLTSHLQRERGIIV